MENVMINYVDAIKELTYLPKETASAYLIELINLYQAEYEVSFEEAYSDLTGVYIDAMKAKTN
jgi:hypothetical protein